MLRISDNPLARWPEDRSLDEDLGHWWVVRVKPRNEKALAHDLSRIGVGYYLPMMIKRSIRRDNNKPRKSIICLFPGYLPLAGYEENKTEILRTGRIINVIRVLDQERFVRELGSIKKALDHIKEVGLHPKLAVGQRVMIISGPLEGVEGVIKDISRPNLIYLNVEMFNRAVSVTLSSAELTPI